MAENSITSLSPYVYFCLVCINKCRLLIDHTSRNWSNIIDI